MLRFYAAAIIKRVPGVLFSATDLVVSLAGVVIFLLTLFNKSLAKAITDTWGGFSPWWSVIPIALVFIWLVLRAMYEAHSATAVQLRAVQSRVDELEARPRPNLVCSVLQVDERPTGKRSAWLGHSTPFEASVTTMNVVPAATGSDSQAAYFDGGAWSPWFAHIGFKNDPETPGEEATARSVRATIEFRGVGMALLEIPGRWTESGQPTDPFESTKHLETIDMVGNGQTHLLDVAIRNGWNGNAHAFNTDSYWAQPWGFRSEYLLAPDEVDVRVALQGENTLKETWEFKLSVSTEHKPMRLVHVSGNSDVETSD